MARKPLTLDDALPAVLALALALRVLLFITALPDHDRFFTLDARGYMALAQDLHAGYLEPASALWAVGLARTPVYPIFASALLNISGGSVAAVVLGQLFLGLIAIGLTHRIADEMFGRRAAILAALLLALDPATAVFTNRLQPESLFTVFLLAGFIAWRKALAGAGITSAIVAGAFLGLATLTRPIGLFLPIPVLILAAMSRRAVRGRMARSAAVLLPFALIVGGWMARNALHTGVPVLSTIEGVNLLDYRAAGAIAVEENRAIEDVRVSLAEELVRRGTASNSPALHSRAQSRLAMEVLREHPYGAIRSAAEGVARLTLGTGLTALSGLRGDPDPEEVVGPIEHLLQALLALLLTMSYLAATLGVTWLIRRGDFASLATVVVFLLYFVLISAGPEANTRFRIPAVPFIAILGGLGLARLQKPAPPDPASPQALSVCVLDAPAANAQTADAARYRTYDELTVALRGLAQTNTSLVKLVDLGPRFSGAVRTMESPRPVKEGSMALSLKDAKIAEMNRFLDDLERAAGVSPAAFDKAFNSPPSGLSVHEINTKKEFIRVSPAHRGVLGYTPAEMVGKSPLDYVVMRGLSESATSRKLTPGAILAPNTRSFRKADETEITLLQVERHLKDAQGQVIGIRTVVTEAPKEGPGQA